MRHNRTYTLSIRSFFLIGWLAFALLGLFSTYAASTEVIYPVKNEDAEKGMVWYVRGHDFGYYVADETGFHGGEDWNLYPVRTADLGKPVYAIADGTVKQVHDLGSRGWLVAIEHLGSFVIPGRTDTKKMRGSSSQSYTYPTENVDKTYSIYIHLDGDPILNGYQHPPVAPEQPIRKRSVVGHIMDSGNGPHLHFEIRHPNARHSPASWSMVGDRSNWTTSGKGVVNGSYKSLQQMVDDGLRHPSDFLAANSGHMTLKVFEFWKKDDPIYADLSSDLAHYNFDAQYKVRNDGTDAIKIDDLALAVHDANGNHLFDLVDPMTGAPRHYKQKLDLGEQLWFTQSVAYIRQPGNYKLIAKALIKSAWADLASLDFTAQNAVQALTQYRGDGPPACGHGLQRHRRAQGQRLSSQG